MDPETADPILTSRVRFEETDMQGIVFYGNYLTYMDMAHNELLRAIGGLPEGVSEHVVHTDLDYRGQATFEDVVHHYTRFTRIGGSSMEAEYAAYLEDGTLLVEGTGVYVAVDGAGDTVRLPDEWRERVADYQDEPPLSEG
jgi:acyl-CoA thioester hydrolase